MGWNPQHVPIDPESNPEIYGIWLDFPELGAEGRRVLFVIYHATPIAQNPMSEPWRKYTLLSITEPADLT